jgi:hypothetical protein
MASVEPSNLKAGETLRVGYRPPDRVLALASDGTRFRAAA